MRTHNFCWCSRPPSSPSSSLRKVHHIFSWRPLSANNQGVYFHELLAGCFCGEINREKSNSMGLDFQDYCRLPRGLGLNSGCGT